MNIGEFKVGDIITRNEGMAYKHNAAMVDGSYAGDRLILRGHDTEAKIIFLEKAGRYDFNSIIDLSYARDAWDEGWCLYPETLWQKIKSAVSREEAA